MARDRIMGPGPHLIERGNTDLATKLRHTAELAWRALALLQQELEDAGLAPKARAIAGTRLWLEQGMEEQNAFGRWLAERAETRSGVKTNATRLYADWKEWCAVNGEHAGTQSAFGPRLRALYQRRIIAGRYYYQDIVLKEITWPGIE